MKKLLSLLLALVMVLSMISCTPADNGETPPASDGETAETCRVVVATDPVTEYTVDLSKVTVNEGLMSVLDYLKQTEGLTYTETEGAYGAYLTAVGSLTAGDNSYISLYTSVDADKDVSAYATTVTYNGVTLTSSGVGASGMTIEDGGIYYICLITY